MIGEAAEGEFIFKAIPGVKGKGKNMEQLPLKLTESERLSIDNIAAVVHADPSGVLLGKDTKQARWLDSQQFGDFLKDALGMNNRGKINIKSLQFLACATRDVHDQGKPSEQWEGGFAGLLKDIFGLETLMYAFRETIAMSLELDEKGERLLTFEATREYIDPIAGTKVEKVEKAELEPVKAGYMRDKRPQSGVKQDFEVPPNATQSKPEQEMRQ